MASERGLQPFEWLLVVLALLLAAWARECYMDAHAEAWHEEHPSER